MADHCSICDTRRPLGGTEILVLNDGALWLEVCHRPECRATPVTNAETGETITVGELFAKHFPPSEPEQDDSRLMDDMEQEFLRNFSD